MRPMPFLDSPSLRPLQTPRGCNLKQECLFFVLFILRTLDPISLSWDLPNPESLTFFVHMTFADAMATVASFISPCDRRVSAQLPLAAPRCCGGGWGSWGVDAGRRQS